MPRYIRLDGTAFYHITDNLKVTLNVRNILDAKYIRSAQQNSLTEIYPGDPRTVMVGLSGKL